VLVIGCLLDIFDLTMGTIAAHDHARSGGSKAVSGVEGKQDVTLFLGVARLPKALWSEYVPCLMLELVVDVAEQRVVDVASNIALPNYNALLRNVLLGRRFADIGQGAQEFTARCHGPLLRPTVAAIKSALAQANTDGDGGLEDAASHRAERGRSLRPASRLGFV
jgi:hypothetical protein